MDGSIIRPRKSLATLESLVREAGSDSLDWFSGRYQGGMRLQQHPTEFARLLQLCQQHGPLDTYLEIGVAAGGSARLMWEQVGFRRGLFIDDQGHPAAGDQLTNLAGFRNISRIYPCSTRAYGDSDISFIASEFLRRELYGRRLSVVLLDGDHSYNGLKADFELVQPYLQPDTLVVFHDIVAPFVPGVGQFWQERQQYGLQTVAEYLDSTQNSSHLGIGVARLGKEGDVSAIGTEDFWEHCQQHYPHWFARAERVLELAGGTTRLQALFASATDHLLVNLHPDQPAADCTIATHLQHMQLPRLFHTVVGHDVPLPGAGWHRKLKSICAHLEKPDGGLFMDWPPSNDWTASLPEIANQLEDLGLHVHQLGENHSHSAKLIAFWRKSIVPASAPPYFKNGKAAPVDETIPAVRVIHPAPLRLSHSPPPFPQHLWFHLYPGKTSQWRWHLELLRKYQNNFNGSRTLYLALDETTVSEQEVRHHGQWLEGFDWIMGENNTYHECIPFDQLVLPKMCQSQGWFFYAHGKGTTYDFCITRSLWCLRMWEWCQSEQALEARKSRLYDVIGCYLLDVAAANAQPWSKYHFAGTFYWVRVPQPGMESWRPHMCRHGSELWPGQYIPQRRAHCLYGQNVIPWSFATIGEGPPPGRGNHTASSRDPERAAAPMARDLKERS